MRRVWVLLLAAAQAGAQEFSEAELDRAIREIGRGEIEYVRKVGAWGPAARRAVPALVAAWRVPGRTFEDAVDAALRAMGPYAFPEVVKALGGRDGPVRWSAEDFLEARSREAPSVPLDPGLDGAFLDLLDHKDPRARAAVARALATRGGAVVPKLVPLLGTGSPGRRHAAAFALSWIEPPPEDARAALLAATSDKDAAVRAQALAAVARLKSSGSEILRCLLAALKDRADGVVAAAVAGLVGRGPPLAEILSAWDDDPSAPHATEVLVRLGDGALEPVREALRSGDARRKRRAAECLGRIAATRIVPAEAELAHALADPDSDVRLGAADSLGIALPAVSSRAIDALLAAAKDADPRVRAAAAAGAARAAPDDPRVVALVKAAQEDPDPAMKLVAAAVEAKSPEQCGAVARNPAAPVAARVLVAERVRGMNGLPGGEIEAFGRVVADRSLPPDLRAEAADAIATIALRRLFGLRHDAREQPATKGFQAAAGNALAWLAGTQRTRERKGDGRWKTDAFRANHDIGVTGLALLTFLAAGQTDRAPSPYAGNVREGFEWLLSRQSPEGLFREGPAHDHTLLEHAIATHALCELVAMTGDDTFRPQAQRAVDCCAAVRGPVGWRYAAKGEQTDTNVTTWMTVALCVAGELAFDVDPECREVAYSWIDTVTSPLWGTAGYDRPDGAASRPVGWRDRYPPDKTEAMTACGIVCRIFLGEDPASSYLIPKGADACARIPPKWNEDDGSIDMYYWYYGSLAAFHAGDKWWAKWAPALGNALLGSQQADGSWKAVDVWQDYGGAVYSTTMCALALLTPWRYPRGFAARGKPPAPYATAVAALAEAKSSPCERLRAAATRALARCPGGR